MRRTPSRPLSGVLGGVAMALYVGRLQSKFRGSALWLPPLLYFYTTLQPLYAHIGRERKWAVWIITGMLALKCLLYLYVVWLFRSSRLLFYFLRVRRVYETVVAEWKNFYSISKRSLKTALTCNTESSAASDQFDCVPPRVSIAQSLNLSLPQHMRASAVSRSARLNDMSRRTILLPTSVRSPDD